MKKSLKKVLAVILSAIMLVSCSATSVFAAPGSSIASLLQVASTVKSGVDYGKSLVTLGSKAADAGKNLPKRVVNIVVSYVDLQKANGDLVKALIQNGISDLTFLPKLTVSNIKLGSAVASSTVNTASGSVKLVIALVQFPPAVLKDAVSVGKLGSTVASGLATNLSNDVKLGVNGLKVVNTAKGLVTPSLSDLIEGIKFPIRAGTAVKNIVSIAKGDKDENAKPLVGTAQITDHGEDLGTTEEETSLSASEEEVPAPAASAASAVVASTDGPMD